MKNSANQGSQKRNSRPGISKRQLLAMGLCVCGLAASAQVLPPNSKAYGKTYAEWQSAWYQWAFSLPVTAHPLFDTADCSAGQGGQVWFLGGNFTGKPESRTCTIPPGKALFFPILNTEFDNTGCADSLCPPTSYTADQLLGLVNGNLAGATNLSCTIDGKAVGGLSDVATTPFRAESVFSYTLPADPNNFVDWELVTGCQATPPGCYASGGLVTPVAATGVYLLLHPLSVGEHVIHFHGEIPSIGFVEDITYHLTVALSQAAQ